MRRSESVRVSDVIRDFDYRRREDYVRDAVGCSVRR